MSFEQNQDFVTAQQALTGGREELLASLAPLVDNDLDRSRRGGWSARRVIEHLIQSEWHYGRLVAQLRELPPTPYQDAPERFTSVSDAVTRLTDSRAALLTALAGIDEESFYRLGSVGREEYSVLSVLENVAHHDREHAQQLQAIVTAR